MLDLTLRVGRLLLTASLDWQEPEPDDGPPSPVPHLQPLEPLQVEGLDDDGVEENGGLGFRG